MVCVCGGGWGMIPVAGHAGDPQLPPCWVACPSRRRGAHSPVFAAHSLGPPSPLRPTPESPLPVFRSGGEGWDRACHVTQTDREAAPLGAGGMPLCTRVPQTVMNRLLLTPLGDR